MSEPERSPDAQSGPFERFLQQSSAYREFLAASGPEGSEVADARATDALATEGHDVTRCVDLELGPARFAMSLDLTDWAHQSVSIAFPSRITRPELSDLHNCVRRVIDAAYPQRGLTPMVALLSDRGEIRLDLAKYWDGATYEHALASASLSAVIYYLQIEDPLRSVRFLGTGPSRPDLMYGFMPAFGDSREFISISCLHAQHISTDLVTAFLTRHKDYNDGDLLTDAERLAQQIRSTCKAHTPRTLP